MGVRGAVKRDLHKTRLIIWGIIVHGLILTVNILMINYQYRPKYRANPHILEGV
jgi:hypothetical protein